MMHIVDWPEAAVFMTAIICFTVYRLATKAGTK